MNGELVDYEPESFELANVANTEAQFTKGTIDQTSNLVLEWGAESIALRLKVAQRRSMPLTRSRIYAGYRFSCSGSASGS